MTDDCANFGNGMDFGDDIETARTNFNACGAEVRHCQQQLDNAYRALVSAAEQYGCAVAREEAAAVGVTGEAEK
jgi:hypothetical protein